ncbi:MAG: EF-hand domain-containing protein [Gemmataceae bacterium]
MRRFVILVPALLGAAVLFSDAGAQPPKGKGGKERPRDGGSSLVERMMAFDKNKDGKLTKDEITDERLLRLFDMADANKDGEVTKEELTALAKKLDMEGEEGGRGGFGGKGKGGFGGKGGGKGGFDGKRRGPGAGGRGEFGGPPRPGQVLPPFLVDQLDLTAEQRKQVDALQKEVDDRLAKILTAEQKKRLEGMRQGPPGRGPGGPPKDGPR